MHALSSRRASAKSLVRTPAAQLAVSHSGCYGDDDGAGGDDTTRRMLGSERGDDDVYIAYRYVK